MQIFGESEHQLDDKGRVSVPRRFLSFFNEGGFLTRSFDGECLVYYSKEAWEAILVRIKTIPSTDESADVLYRWLSSGTEVMPDAQGRLTIPPVLRRYANLTSGISLVARGDKMELWDTEIWQQYLAEKLTTDKVRSALKLMDSRDNGINN